MVAQLVKFCARNLFRGWFDSVLSLATIGLIALLAYAFGRWAIVQADWSVITDSMRFMMAGSLSITELWRAWLAGIAFVFMVGISLGQITRARPASAQTMVIGVLALIAVALWATGHVSGAWTSGLFLAAACGGWLSLRLPTRAILLSLGWALTTVVMWNLLVPSDGHAVGGLLLGILITLVAAVASFPLGVLLALGRTSPLPGVRITCVVYIELIRSLPLISILYWAWMVVPLILPGELRINDLVRGAVGFTLFYAAYVAEYVRGGLQGIPEGQWYAARSLGLTTPPMLRYIILPQAIRSVLPGLVGNVLDIFNNVPLLFIIGLTEFVRAGQVILSNPQHSGQLYEMYVFMFLVYLLIATLLSWSSRIVERSMNNTR